MTKQIADTIGQMRDCYFSSLSPQGAQAVWGILALPAYNTEEGRALQASLKAAALQSLEKTEEQLQHRLTNDDKAMYEAELAAWRKVIQAFSGALHQQ